MGIEKNAINFRWLGTIPCFVTIFMLAGNIMTMPAWGASAERETVETRNLLQKADDLWNNRANQENLEAAIKAYENVIAEDPDNLEALTKLARAHYLLAYAYLENSDKKRQIETYYKGVQYGEKGTALNPEFRKMIEAGKKMEEAIKVLGNEYLGAIYWTASNLGKWAKAKGLLSILTHKDKAKKAMERIIEIDERFFYGAPHRYLGAYYAFTPGIIGGDLKKSEEHFKKALEIEPNYLGTWVLKADSLDTKLKDKDLYRRDIQHVIDAPVDSIPEIIPEQIIEKQKAKMLLEQIDSRF